MRNRLQLPHPVKQGMRVAVICPPNSKHADSAREAGAVLVGEQEVFEAIKAGKLDFDRCICQTDSLPALQKAGVARVLGPRGMMPSAKTGTVARDVTTLLRSMFGGSEYRERDAVLRMAIGQLGFSPEQLRTNIKMFIDQVNKDMAALSDRVVKELHEVVLSSTHGPGFSLNGEFQPTDGLLVEHLVPAKMELLVAEATPEAKEAQASA